MFFVALKAQPDLEAEQFSSIVPSRQQPNKCNPQALNSRVETCSRVGSRYFNINFVLLMTIHDDEVEKEIDGCNRSWSSNYPLS